MIQYEGMAVGGPKKGERLANFDSVIQLARMEYRFAGGGDSLQYREIDRGHYEFEAGHWWWKGWSMKR